MVLRNATGKVVGALSERINLPPTVEDVEALACRRAIVSAIELGFHHVVFKRDSATVINHLQEDTPCLASFGNAIADSQSPWQVISRCASGNDFSPPNVGKIVSLK